MRLTSRRVLTASGALGLVLTLGACGSTDPDAAPDADDPYRPSDSPSPAVTMDDGPADYSEIEGSGFTIKAPGEFQQLRTTSRNDEPMLVLESPSQVPTMPQRVVVIRDVAPRAPATEQSFALETLKSSGAATAGARATSEPAVDVLRTSVPAADDALPPGILVTWEEQRAAAGAASVEVTYWQLFQQVGDGLILNVVALAPSSEFETSEVSRILRTFVADPEAV